MKTKCTKGDYVCTSGGFCHKCTTFLFGTAEAIPWKEKEKEDK